MSVTQSAVSLGVWPRVLRGIVLLVFLVLTWILIARIPRTTTIFLIGALIAFAIEPISKRLQNHMPKVAAIALVYLVLTLIIVLGFAIVMPLMNEQLRALAVNVPSYVLALEQWQNAIALWLQHEMPRLHVAADTSGFEGTGNERIGTIASASIASVGTLVADTAGVFFVIFSAISVSIFFLAYDTQVADGFASLFLKSRRDTARKLSAEIADMFGRYMLGTATVSAVTALAVAGLSAIAGFKLPWVLFIITFVGYSIPMFGMVVAQLIAISCVRSKASG